MTTDPTTETAPHDYRITAISEALLEHRDSWTVSTSGGVAFDTELAAVIAVRAIELVQEENALSIGRLRACRHACHEAELENNVTSIREWCDFSGQKHLGEEIVSMLMDEVE